MVFQEAGALNLAHNRTMSFPSNSRALLSWGRYLYWADQMQRDWDRFMTEKRAEAIHLVPEWLGVSSYWGASLYVVIEGWEMAKFTDPIVDALLRIDSYKDMLRRLRNGTFHYQPELLPEKVTQFFRSPEVTLWLSFLHEEFCRWLRDCMDIVEHTVRMSSEESLEWQRDCAKIFGWVPFRLAERELQDAKKRFDEIEAELNASGSTSESALDLRKSLGLYDAAVKQTDEAVRQYRRDRLAELGLNPDNYIP